MIKDYDYLHQKARELICTFKANCDDIFHNLLCDGPSVFDEETWDKAFDSAISECRVNSYNIREALAKLESLE